MSTTDETERPVQAGPTTLAEARRYFWSMPTARLITAYLAVAVVARLLAGPFQWTELLVPVVILALEPFVEWVIHVVVLHWKPRQVGGRVIDLYAAREHRRHHADPRNLEILGVPMRLLVIQVPLVVAAGLLLASSTTVALTAVCCGLAMLLVYEWTHFLVHTPYQPRTRWYRKVWRAHRLHHYRNEQYWFGVTMHLADHVLGTYPDKSEVELSPTVRSLGIDG